MSHWPQIVVVAAAVLILGIHLGKAGEPMGRVFNPVGVAACYAIELLVLYEGGFFAVWGWTP